MHPDMVMKAPCRVTLKHPQAAISGVNSFHAGVGGLQFETYNFAPQQDSDGQFEPLVRQVIHHGAPSATVREEDSMKWEGSKVEERPLSSSTPVLVMQSRAALRLPN
ncbi:hypothetical protein NQZ68_027598 [Dissostichus eleginoides]|nr:hypothetical protein NQZ68_027598 [Dissostichus eleginoides]